MKPKVIDNFSEYVKFFIDDIHFDYSICRGQWKDWPLLPSGLRNDETGKRKYSNNDVKHYIDEFTMNAEIYLKHPEIIKSYYDKMVLAQHYGVPTFLLDFTSSPLIALLFAVDSGFKTEDEEKSVVWVLNPLKLNELSIGQRENIPLMNLKNYENSFYELPLSVLVKKNNDRVAAQVGQFLIFKEDMGALETMSNAEDFLLKIEIPHSCAKDMLVGLYRMGIRYCNIFPGLEAIAQDLFYARNVEEYIRNEKE